MEIYHHIITMAGRILWTLVDAVKKSLRKGVNQKVLYWEKLMKVLTELLQTHVPWHMFMKNLNLTLFLHPLTF